MRDIREEKNLPFGRFPLGFCSLGDHLGGDAAVRHVGAWSCSSLVQIKVNMLPELQKGKFGNAYISLSPHFVVFVSSLFPKLCSGQICLYGSEKSNSVKKVVFLTPFRSVLK